MRNVGWRGCTDVNTLSIGVETINLGYRGDGLRRWVYPAGTKVQGSPEEWYRYDDALLKTLGPLCIDIVKRYNIKPWNVIGHSDLAPDRNVDPGPFFPWKEFYWKYSIGIWPSVDRKTSEVSGHSQDIKYAQANLRKLGYTACPKTGEFDQATRNVVRAFQLHFRPDNISGELDKETVEILQALIEKYGEAMEAEKKLEQAESKQSEEEIDHVRKAYQEALEALQKVEERDREAMRKVEQQEVMQAERGIQQRQRDGVCSRVSDCFIQ